MICRIVSFLTLVSCVHEMSEHHNEALYYQAEENSDVTVEWQFSSKVSITIPSIKIHCLQLPELKVFFNMDHHFDEPQHEQFAGRVQCDEDALTTGRVRLHLSRVGTNDSGRYLCRMATQFGRKIKEFRLSITEKPNYPQMYDKPLFFPTVKPKPVTPKPKPERQRRRISLVAGLALGAGEVAVLIAFIMLILPCIIQHRQQPA